ncbi:MAG TPA: hypothetical protein VMH83_04545 [Candidatus Acidoferrum sp.]|nr:hypothetical protein [Candidatus Acidoferrum sp.]
MSHRCHIRPLPLALAMLMTASLAQAHTTLETPAMSEGVRVLNNEQIGHACGAGTSVIGTSVVFPDGKDSTLLVNGAPYNGTLSDFISNWGPNIQPLLNHAVFNYIDEKNDANGNVVGFQAGGGAGMPDHMVAYVPFRVNATNFNPASCATSVKFHVSIVDICKITDGTHIHDAGVANFWTSNTLSTNYDSSSASEDAASLTINRNLAANPLPASCGGVGTSVDVRNSALQLNRDMPIRINGTTVWPQP